VVGDEVDALADPHRGGQVAVGGLEAGEVAVARAVNPEHARCAAAIAFPPCGVARVPAQDDRAVGSETDVLRQSVGVLLGQSAFQRHAPQPDFAWRARRGAGVDDRLAVGRPADHLHARCRLVGQSAWLAAVGGHHIHFGVPLVAGDEGNPLPVGREARGDDIAKAGGQAARVAPVHRNRPQVILASKRHRVAVYCRKAVVALAHRRSLRVGGIRRTSVASCWGGCQRQHTQQTQA